MSSIVASVVCHRFCCCVRWPRTGVLWYRSVACEELSCKDMAYAIIEFLALQEVEVVPSTWIKGNRCAWPPEHIKGDKIVAMVKKAAMPDASWKCFEVSVKGLFGTYELARRKLNQSERDSDLNTDSDVPRKRSRKPPQPWSDSDDSEASQTPAKTQRKGAVPVPRNFPLGLASAECGEQSEGCSESDFQELASLCEKDTSGVGQERSRPFDSSPARDQDFKQHVLRLLNIIRFTQQQHGEMLNKLCEVLPAHAVITTLPLIDKPFDSLERLLAFSEQLDKEKVAVLVRELVQLGGKNANAATKRMLAPLLPDKLASKFSWVGRKNKLNFSNLKASSAIIAAATQFPQEPQRLLKMPSSHG
ncbi:uncharacterized protein [Dermacentor albipictus]|uniref:uncharacterized protein isoform X2 n=1 Tax=Dermacentor albipictus TaxID=60249 RepID=UPI0031FD8A11